jgi:hypothetical protein
MTVDELLGKKKTTTVNDVLATQSSEAQGSPIQISIPEPAGVETGPLPEQAGPMPGPGPRSWGGLEENPLSGIGAAAQALVPTSYAQGGAMFGGLVPGPWGIATAGAGGMGGRVLDLMAANHWQLGSQLMEGVTSRDPVKINQIMDALSQDWPNIESAGKAGAGGQLLGMGASKVLAPVLKGAGSLLARATLPAASPTLTTGLEETLTAGERLALKGQPKPAGMMLGLEKKAASVPAGFVRQQALEAETDSAAHDAMTEFVKRVSPAGPSTPEGTGARLYTGLGQARKKAAAPLSKMYNEVWDLATPQPRPMPNLMAAQTAIAGPAGVQTLGDLPPGMISPKILMVLGMAPGGQAPLRTMQIMRSNLAKVAAASEEGIGSQTPEGVHALSLLAGIDKDMSETLDTLPPHVKPLYEEAQRRWGTEVRELFVKPKVMKQVRQLADQGKYASMLPLIFPRGAETGPLESVKKALPVNQFNRLVGSWWQDLVNKSTENGTFSMGRLLTNVEPRNIDPQRFVKAFDKDHAADLQSVFKTMRDIKQIRELGAVVPQSDLYRRLAFLMGAVTTGTYLGGPLGGAVGGALGTGAEMLMPQALARILFSKTGARTLAAALDRSAPADYVVRAAIRLRAIAQWPMPGEQAQAPEPQAPDLRDPQAKNTTAFPPR